MFRTLFEQSRTDWAPPPTKHFSKRVQILWALTKRPVTPLNWNQKGPGSPTVQFLPISTRHGQRAQKQQQTTIAGGATAACEDWVCRTFVHWNSMVWNCCLPCWHKLANRWADHIWSILGELYFKRPITPVKGDWAPFHSNKRFAWVG
jgi:hypothetical protein